MSTIFTDLNIEIQHKRLVQFRTRLGSDRLAPLFQFDEVPLRLYFCQPTGIDLEPFDLQDWSGDAVTVAVNTTALTGSSSETALALQSTWDWNSSLTCFEGLLDLANTAVDSYLGSLPSRNAVLEVKVVHNSGGTQRYLQETFTLKASAIEMPVLAPPPGMRYLLEGEQRALFAYKIGPAGERQRWTNAENTFSAERWVDTDGTLHDDPVTL